MSKEEKTVKREGNLLQLKSPRFLSLVARGANRTPFKIIREDGEVEKIEVDSPAPHTEDTISRSDRIVSLTLPAGLEEAEVEKVLSMYGFEDVERSKDDQGRYVVRMTTDEDEDQKTTTIEMPDGAVATIRIDKDTVPRVNVFAQLVGMKFTSDFGNIDTVNRYLELNEIDFNSVKEEESGEIVVERLDKEHTASINMEGGFSLLVRLDEEEDMPEMFQPAIMETMYGSFGNLQMDFSAKLADMEYSNAAREAVDMLKDSLSDILYWEALTVSQRRDLKNSVLESFNNYVEGLLDTLPIVRQSSDINLKEKAMSQDKDVQAKTEDEISKSSAESEKTIEREDVKAEAEIEEIKAEEQSSEEVSAEESQESTLSRSEVSDMIDQKFEALSAAILERLDAKKEESAKEEVKEEEIKREDKEEEKSEVSDVESALLSRIDELTKKVEEITVVRSESADAKPQEKGPDAVFTGIFSNR